jgi:hypothetical protein
MHDELLLEVAVNLSPLTLQRNIASDGLNPLLVLFETLRKEKEECLEGFYSD